MALPRRLQGVAPPAPPPPPPPPPTSSPALPPWAALLPPPGPASSAAPAGSPSHMARAPPSQRGVRSGRTSQAPGPPCTSAPPGPRSLRKATLLCHTYTARSKGHWAGG